MNPLVKQIILLTQTKREEQIIFNSAITLFLFTKHKNGNLYTIFNPTKLWSYYLQKLIFITAFKTKKQYRSSLTCDTNSLELNVKSMPSKSLDSN